MVARLSDACLDHGALVAQPLLRAAQRQSQRSQVLAAEIGEFDALEMVPDALVRMKLGRIARQMLQMKTLGGSLAQEVLDGLPAMDRRAIPDDQQLAAYLAQ